MYLLDTCVISELIKSKPSANVTRWIGEQPESALYLSALSFGEIEQGIARLASGVKKKRLTAWARNDLPARFGERVWSVDSAVAASWGFFQGESKQSLPVVDGLIAAIARVHNLTLVTRNTKDFARFDIPLLDPW
jgi:predicted nucleic acid-binding protein